MEQTRLEHLLIFLPVMAVVFIATLYFLPRMILSVYKKAILVKGFGEGPIPINTLYMQPQSFFLNPFGASGSGLSTAGVNGDTLITIGWLDLRNGQLLLHVPRMAGRYYSIQFTDPGKNTVFAYVGTRTTGSESGDYLIGSSRKHLTEPHGEKRILSPRRFALLIGRVLVYDESDLPAAYALEKQITLKPLPR